MTATTVYYVSHCPLDGLCRWHSAPQMTEQHASEALRAHVNEHRHADLVQFVTEHHTVTMSRFAEVS